VVHKRPAAKRELGELATYLALDREEVALRFLDAAERTFELLARMPGLGAP
jgi:plasmid stabilization system protein ParE